MSKRETLRHMLDDRPGLARRGRPGRFTYQRPSGSQEHDAATLARIRHLAIPPAWTDVWIATDPHAHLQATGRDARGRKQYRYHQKWQEKQATAKYRRLEQFARALPRMRHQLRHDLRAAETSRAQVLALLVSLLESTYIRVGNNEYRRANNSYGLTTLEDRHVSISGQVIAFNFRGKSGKTRSVELRDRRLARLVKRCRDLEGRHLFQYLDHAGRRRPARSSDLNSYIAAIADGSFSAKDFRTWGASLLAAGRLDERGGIVLGVPGKTAMVEDIAFVASELGNTPAICRKSYIHPAILRAYQDESAYRRWERTRKGKNLRGLTSAENRLLRYLTALSP